MPREGWAVTGGDADLHALPADTHCFLSQFAAVFTRVAFGSYKALARVVHLVGKPSLQR